jgi:hypothetical protein
MDFFLRNVSFRSALDYLPYVYTFLLLLPLLLLLLLKAQNMVDRLAVSLVYLNVEFLVKVVPVCSDWERKELFAVRVKTTKI